MTDRKRKADNGMELKDGISPRLTVHYPTVRAKTDITEIKADIEELGFAVVENILSNTELTDFENLFWEAITARQPKLQQNDRSTWTAENCDWRGTYGAGQYKHYGMAQEKHCWMIRKNKDIRAIFEGIFNEECVVSIDGAAALFRPYSSKLDLHVDLVPDIPGYEVGSIQSSFNVYEVKIDVENNKAGAGFVCVPGSHKAFDAMWEARRNNNAFKWPKKHWQTAEEDCALRLDTVLVVNPANSMILWDSKLLHRNYGGDYSAQELGHICRLTQFVCWQPKRFRTEKAKKKKIQNVLEGKCGNHWAVLGFTEPIKPFPAWGNHTTKIIVPFQGVKKLPEEIEELL